MKKKISIILLVLLIGGSILMKNFGNYNINLKSQNYQFKPEFSKLDGDPTLQDAVNFIKKVFTEVGKNTNDKLLHDDGINIWINNCVLYESTCFYETSNGSQTEQIVYKKIDTLTIDLSNVYYDKINSKMIALHKGAIKDNSYLISSKHKVNIYDHNMDYHSIKWDNKDLGLRVYDNDALIQLILFPTYYEIEVNDIYNRNNYGPRLDKTYEFLVRSCGGGKIKPTTEDKF